MAELAYALYLAFVLCRLRAWAAWWQREGERRADGGQDTLRQKCFVSFRRRAKRKHEP